MEKGTDPLNKPTNRYRVLLGTANPSKIEILRAFLQELPIDLLEPADLNLQLSVIEDGMTIEENAAIKSRAYFTASHIPTFAVDASLTVLGFPPEKQPGVFVRRIFGDNQEVSDQQLLEYYMRELQAIGGKSTAFWKVGSAFTVSDTQTFQQTYAFEALLTDQPSPKLLPGVPLSSLMIDPNSGKYLSELDHRQRPDAIWVKKIMQENLSKIK